MRNTGTARVAIPLLIVVLSVAGYAVATRIVDADRRDAAERRAQSDALQIQRALEQARAFSVGLANALQGERRPEGRRFAALQGSATTTVGLTTAMWVESVSAAERQAYERRTGNRITSLPGSGPTPPAAGYLPATFITGVTLPAGEDMAGERALASTLRDPASMFAGTASPVGSLAGRRGFFLVQGTRFGRGPGSRGYLVVFVPAAWPSASIGHDPDQTALSLDGRSLDGALRSPPAASRRFDALARRWQVHVAPEPATALLEALPWLALVWLPATALIAYLVGRGILRRRRAEREVDDIFDLSLDLLCTAGLDDGYLNRVNPAFERTLGYRADELLSRPFIEFVHPDDRGSTMEAMGALRAGRNVVAFENRFLRADGGVSWLQWNTRPSLESGLMYAAARDVTHARILVGEQAALRRVATLVARGAPAPEIFDGVARETRQMLDADASAVLRLESDGTVTHVALDSTLPSPVAVGSRVTSPAAVARAIRTDTSVRAERVAYRELVSAPITVGGRAWGVFVVTWAEARAIPPDSEARLDQFKELIATAVANAESRAQLVASRARVVATADETRRRIERDLHDGAQQRLVHTVVTLKLAEMALGDADGRAREFVAEALSNAQSAIDEVRELARGIHPRILSRGLAPALRTLAHRCPVPVTLDVREADALPESTDVTAYYVVSEALTNTARHARASRVWITVDVDGSWLHVTVRDDGVGGADPSHGSGLRGLRDRVEALGGALDVRSERDGGTVLHVRIPVDEPTAVGVDI